MGIHQQRKFRLTQHVDESGRDDSPGGIDALFGRGVIEPADRSDPPGAHADVGCEPRRTRAVNHAAMLDDEIVGRQRRIRSERQRAAAREG